MVKCGFEIEDADYMKIKSAAKADCRSLSSFMRKAALDKAKAAEDESNQ